MLFAMFTVLERLDSKIKKKHTGFKGVDLLHFDKLGPPNPFSDQAKIQLKPYIIYF